MRAVAALAKAKFPVKPDILWLSDGIEDGHARAAAEALAHVGNLKIYATATSALALLPPQSIANGYALTLQRAGESGARRGTVEAKGTHGEILSTAPFRFEDGHAAAQAKVTLPLQIETRWRGSPSSMRTPPVLCSLLDSGAPRRAIGVVSASNGDQPLLSDTYYLERALAPYADLHKGNVQNLLNQHVGVLILADVGKIADVDPVAKS